MAANCRSTVDFSLNATRTSASDFVRPVLKVTAVTSESPVAVERASGSPKIGGSPDRNVDGNLVPNRANWRSLPLLGYVGVNVPLVAAIFRFPQYHVYLWGLLGLGSVAAIVIGIIRNKPTRRA